MNKSDFLLVIGKNVNIKALKQRSRSGFRVQCTGQILFSLVELKLWLLSLGSGSALEEVHNQTLLYCSHFTRIPWKTSWSSWRTDVSPPWKLAWVRECVQSNATWVAVGHLWISHSSDWTCGKLRELKKEEESVHRVLLIKNEFAISALRNLPLAARLCHVPEQRDSGISAPCTASWLRSAALRAQAAVAPEWCHVVGIYSSKFNFQLSFLPWQKPCLWDFSIQLSLCGSSGMMTGTDPSVIFQKKTTELQSSTKTTYWHFTLW